MLKALGPVPGHSHGQALLLARAEASLECHRGLRLPAATPPFAQARDHLSWRPAVWPLVRSPVCRGWRLTGLQGSLCSLRQRLAPQPLHAYGSF